MDPSECKHAIQEPLKFNKSMEKEQKFIDNSLSAFSQFRDSLKNQTKYSNGNESFKARIIYKWNNNTEQETLKVELSLTTYEYGKIGIEEGDIINTDNVHTEFDAKFQKYTFTEDNYLLIEGNSSKLGKYEIKIIEV